MELTEFAKAHPTQRGSKCWLGGLPELEEIEAAYARGIGPKVIQKWLVEEKGYGEDEARYGRVTNHLNGHKGRSCQR